MRIVVGVSGASGVIIAKRLMEALNDIGAEIHFVMTESGESTLGLETKISRKELEALAHTTYEPSDMAAAISSGSFLTDGMIVLPCSMKTLAGIVSGYTDNLLLRAADVTLKEGRKLVICPREAPMGRIHLRNMYEASQLGATIIPPVMTFYSGQETVNDMVDYLIGKIMQQFGLDYGKMKRWE